MNTDGVLAVREHPRRHEHLLHARSRTTRLSRIARVVHEDRAHHHGGRAIEVPAVGPLRRILGSEPQIGLMHQQAKHAEAVEPLQKTVDIFRRLYGAEDARTVQTQERLDQALAHQK